MSSQITTPVFGDVRHLREDNKEIAVDHMASAFMQDPFFCQLYQGEPDRHLLLKEFFTEYLHEVCQIQVMSLKR